jgi:hypothetical protein
MGDIFDLDALAAEDNPGPFTFRFGGELYELPPVLDLRLAGTFVDGGQGARPDQTLAALLGEEQWQRLLANPAPFSVQMTEALLDRWAKHLGISLGEASGSAVSSGSTAEP